MDTVLDHLEARFDEWLRRYQAEEPIRAKSLLVTILGDSVAPHGAGIWLGSLIALLAPFGVSERLVRTSVFRLCAEGWLEAERIGRRSLYTLSAAGRRRIEHADRRIYGQPAESWDGMWTLVLTWPQELSAQQRADLKRDLLWEGYAPLAFGLYGHPGAAHEPLAEIIAAQGLTGAVAVFEARAAEHLPGLSDADLVVRHWPLEALAARYRSFIARFEPFLREPAWELDPARAFLLCTLLVHAYRRVVLHDPQLPLQLLAADWPGHQAFKDCGSIYQKARQRAEEHFNQAVGFDPRALGPPTLRLLGRFAQALVPGSQG
jgi:phenylacetic acid degradation operon negative regulatory protein